MPGFPSRMTVPWFPEQRAAAGNMIFRDGDNQRAPTGVHGLDVILGGGLFENAIYMITGRPGAGKTILSNQIGSTHVRGGGRAVYVTLDPITEGGLRALLELVRRMVRDHHAALLVLDGMLTAETLSNSTEE